MCNMSEQIENIEEQLEIVDENVALQNVVDDLQYAPYDEFEEDGESIELGSKYVAPNQIKQSVDLASQEQIEMPEITPWDVIVMMAQSQGVTIQEPRKGCKHCYGRGWPAKDAKTGAPVPCSCIFPPVAPAVRDAAQLDRQMIRYQMAGMNRSGRRRIEKSYFKHAKLLKNSKTVNQSDETLEKVGA